MSTNHVHPQYDDGLEVAHYEGPESLPARGIGDGLHQYELGQKIVVPPASPEKDLKPPGPSFGTGSYPGGIKSAWKPWYKRKVVLGAISAALVVAIGLGVGLGVGLTSNGDSSKDDPSSNSSTGDEGESICEEGFCGKILSLNVHEDALYVFGRSHDRTTIDYIKYDGSSSEWEEWDNLGTMSDTELVSPPSSQTWPVNGTAWRLDVFAVGSRNGTLWNKWHDEAEGWGEWDDIGQGAGSPVSTCFVTRGGFPNRLDAWTTDKTSGKIIKVLWQQHEDFEEEDFDGNTAENGQYAGWFWNDPLVSSSLPAVVCPFDNDGDSRYHEVMWYKENGRLSHSYYSDEDWWREPQELEGKWIGEPSLLATNDNNTDAYFFGVQENREMYFLKPDDLNPESLKGNITSVPALRSIEEGGRVDIVALRSDGNLVHQHHDGVDWLSEWEDLDVKAASAPAVRSFGDDLFIFAVNAKGELMVWTLGSDSGANWRDGLGEGQNLRGRLSLEYWTQNE